MGGEDEKTECDDTILFCWGLIFWGLLSEEPGEREGL